MDILAVIRADAVRQRRAHVVHAAERRQLDCEAVCARALRSDRLAKHLRAAIDLTGAIPRLTDAAVRRFDGVSGEGGWACGEACPPPSAPELRWNATSGSY